MIENEKGDFKKIWRDIDNHIVEFYEMGFVPSTTTLDDPEYIARLWINRLLEKIKLLILAVREQTMSEYADAIEKVYRELKKEI